MRIGLICLLLLFPYICYGADIDVGTKTDESTAQAAYTFVQDNNSANATGTIDYIYIKIGSTAGGSTVDVASFYGTAPTFSTRGTAQEITVAASQVNELTAPGNFTAFDINTGDYIGAYGTAQIYYGAETGFNVWYKSGDNIPASSVTFTNIADREMTLYAEGTIAGAERHEMFTVF